MPPKAIGAERSNYTMNRMFLRYCHAGSLRKNMAAVSTELFNVAGNAKEPLGNVSSPQPLGALLQRAADAQEKQRDLFIGNVDTLIRINERSEMLFKWSTYGLAVNGIVFSIAAACKSANDLLIPSLIMMSALIASLAWNLIAWYPSETALSSYYRISYLGSLCAHCGKAIEGHQGTHQEKAGQ